ncbi:hypothetical protein GOP47_0013378 [Adiantum capillus-veneris]|uniref:Nucleolar complex protein 2 homolog n=1 Tax=Adiantum capillus-veneris TaxID=13818 RepID=A0A9D4UPC8_ADICA|nr:hypothetical protein GOP47_0013378 [Adiantum capillus-veneris]
MGKTVKSAKKFAKKHLKSAIAHRRKLKPIKKSFKRKLASFSSAGRQEVGKSEAPVEKLATKKIKDMNADEFLDGKFMSSDDNASISSDDDNDDFDEGALAEDPDGDFIDITPTDLQEDDSEDDEEEEDSSLRSQNKSLSSEVEKHKRQLEKLKEKDPEFFKFLEEHDKELLEFSDEEEKGADDTKEALPKDSSKDLSQVDESSSRLTTTLVDAWCRVIKEEHHMGTVFNLLRAYRTACHYGDGEEEAFANKYSIASSHVFNKVMFFTLSEMDHVFRKILGIDAKDGFVFEPEKISRWKKVEPLVKSYFGNTLHILTQMTDNQMISFTLKRLKASTCFLGALPRFARKYLKVALHFWGRGEGSVSLVSFLFVREMALLLGTDQLDACLKGIYKEYAANSKFVTASAFPRIRFMVNCVVELYGVDLAAAYQQAFVFIRQLAIILRNALTMKTKESYKHVYSWQFINCLELWVQVLCTYADKKDLQPLVYPLTQIISGVAHLVPTTRFFPLRMHCIQLLNRLAAATGMYIPVSALLLDMLEFKELSKTPTGVGKSVDFGCVLKISKPNLKTRAFQDECIAATIEQLSEHLRQWSYSVAFPELAVVPLLGLRRFAKATKVDRFKRQVKQLVDQIEQNIEYVGRKRDGVNFSPKDSQLVASFLQEEKLAGCSPLSKFSASLRQSAEQRRSNLHASSVLVKEGFQRDRHEKDSSSDDEQDEEIEGATAFSSDWLPPKKAPRLVAEGEAKTTSSKAPAAEDIGEDSDAEDVVEDLDLSDDDDVVDDEVEPSSDEEKITQPKVKRGKQKVPNQNGKKANASLPKKKLVKRKRGTVGQRGDRKQSTDKFCVDTSHSLCTPGKLASNPMTGRDFLFSKFFLLVALEGWEELFSVLEAVYRPSWGIFQVQFWVLLAMDELRKPPIEVCPFFLTRPFGHN